MTGSVCLFVCLFVCALPGSLSERFKVHDLPCRTSGVICSFVCLLVRLPGSLSDGLFAKQRKHDAFNNFQGTLHSITDKHANPGNSPLPFLT